MLKEKIYHTKFDDKSALTIVDYLNDDYQVVARGMAICSPKDNWDRKRGNRIAIGRALKAITLAKNVSSIDTTHIRHCKDHKAMRTALGMSHYKGTYYGEK